MKKTAMVLALTGALGMTSTAHATLFLRPGGMVYDDVLNIIWLQDANYAETSGYDTDGQMDWNAAMTWANNLVYGGYSDWRLPNALNYQDGSGPCGPGYNCNSSEMGYMFYTNLGGIANTPISAHHNANYNLFSNIQDSGYWSGTEFSPGAPGDWVFVFHGGFQFDDEVNEFYAWAVRPGDVAVAAVPEPVTVLVVLYKVMLADAYRHVTH